ncbi:MAG: phosphoribosylglycinamide formyltransferase [Nitrospinae bacterium]|nr:phosphoribosylglycinamide formyltransferase [Nitrospinota bacterium]
MSQANSKKNIAVLISGRGSNLQAIIDAVEGGAISASLRVVVSNVQSAHGLERARKHGSEAVFLDPKAYPARMEFDAALVDLLKSRETDLVCLAGYMRILSPGFIRSFSGRIMNIHPALLPAFPGLDVQKKALEHGVKFSGCTVHFVDEGVDTGPIIMQSVVPVLDGDDVETLSARILKEEHRIYPLAIQAFVEGRVKVEGRRVRILKT